ncbi:MAG TPA: glycosyltransferase [Fibrobacteria bacterium]|nr:glycosyltransferase [Fibrobacteria bacterium]
MRILICPLDWGLGHATRCIPLIRALLANGHQVRVGAAGGGLRLLRNEFPGLETFEYPGYPVRYSRSPACFLPVLLAQAPRVLIGLFAESRRLRGILAAHPCDLIISDGRYGVYASGIPAIFITHQVFIRVPGRFPGAGLAEKAILALNLRLLRRYTRVWVPDFPGADSLSGDLSHKPCGLANLEFIHPLSRFSGPGPSAGTGAEGEAAASGDLPVPSVDILAVVSGPEPQRGLFETALRGELLRLQGTRVLVRGLPGAQAPAAAPAGLLSIRPGALTEFAHLSGGELSRLFAGAALIVARSGYTTVMELAGLGCRAVVLVPTPGQSEQEYLADHLDRAGAGIRMDQHALDLEGARERLRDRPGFARWKRDAWKSPEGGAFSLSGFLSGHPVFAGAGAWKDAMDVRKVRQL